MFGRLLGAAFAVAMLLAGANTLHAQNLPSLDQCRDEAVRRGISGDRLTAFLNTCLSTPVTSTSGQRAGLDRCRADAISRNLAGEARNVHIDNCMQQSGATGTANTTGSYSFCRTQARGQGLMGTQLDEFLNRCISQ